jgi:hypothetical protein
MSNLHKKELNTMFFCSTIIKKNHFEVFLVTSKKQRNGIIESKVGLYSIKASSHIFVS